jgi:hypothetical protein
MPLRCLLCMTGLALLLASAPMADVAQANSLFPGQSKGRSGTGIHHGPGKTGQGGTGSGASPGMGSGSGMGSAGSGHSGSGGQSQRGTSSGSMNSGSAGSPRR